MINRVIHKTVLACTVVVANVAFSAAPTVPISSQNLFVPKGFDDNDQVTVVLDGYLPSSCYRVDHVEKTIDSTNKTITVQQFARVYPGPCLLMLVPYASEVNIGVVPKGDYKIVTNNGALAQSLNVAASSNAGPDDFLYAPVEQARVERSDDGSLVALLEGRFTNSCMQFKEVKVIYSGATLEVLPVIELADREDCMEQQVPFSKLIPLNQLDPGRYLLHVRSLNGHAINSVFAAYETGDPIF